ncbi:MAG: polysaccharide deacetylase family protein [Acidimicrobiales bacterium]|nr:polysaccharide deacetylase family protein [Acidimicrobiales bacterium]
MPPKRPRRANPVTFTVDVEDHRPDPSWPVRYASITHQLLDWFDSRAIAATFFVVGELAVESPALVTEIASRGHELALHNWRHEPLTAMRPAQFRDWVRRGKGVIEDLTGAEVVGFRAPTGSVVPETLWCIDVLAEEGYLYDSSVVPTRNPLYQFPGAPQQPFRWPNGLAEVGIAVLGIGGIGAPFGGTYIRLLPLPVLKFFLTMNPPAPGGSLYVHPHDFDLDEPRWRVPDAGRLSPLLWAGRRSLWKKLDWIHQAFGASAPLRDQLHTADQGGVFHDPLVPTGNARLTTT